ncbi:hypothetical protein DRO33_05415 [Candidatus Bathyarchaeota archaeon]|nr:MAG: hypothetical protein DRO33_05415 [Candidatus Bathyarchaeota archaeon]
MGRFKPLFGPRGPRVPILRFVDGPVVGFWSMVAPAPETDILSDIPPIRTLVHADGTVPGSSEVRRDLWEERVEEELRAFNAWVRRLEMKGFRPPFRNLRPDPDNPRIFYCDHHPGRGRKPITFKIKLPPKYPEQPPRTEGLSHLAFGEYRIGGEPCLGDILKAWELNWRRWGIAHFLALVQVYASIRPGRTLTVR